MKVMDEDVLKILLFNKKLNRYSNKEYETYFKELIDKLDKYYGIKMDGFLTVTIYEGTYDTLIEIEREETYYKRIEMQINKIEVVFFYEVDDIIPFINNEVYLYKNKYYVRENDGYNVYEWGKLNYKDSIDIVKYGVNLT